LDGPHPKLDVNCGLPGEQTAQAGENACYQLFTFDQFSALRSPIISANPPAWPALEEVMERYAQLMQRMLEIQSGGRQRSPELIAEDARLMDRLQKRTLAEKPPETVKPSQDGP
jgi:hypothetical protein